MPKIDIAQAPTRVGSDYPPPHDGPCQGRRRWALGETVGLDQFGVNLMRLPPGQWSSQRHWHSAEDEFVWVVEGEVVLVEDGIEAVLRAGDCAGFKAGVATGHHLENRSDREAVLLEMGSRRPEQDTCTYADIDMVARAGEDFYRHRDGTPYPST
ncbi:cupin domain-containing protein [soil metagenome]